MALFDGSIYSHALDMRTGLSVILPHDLREWTPPKDGICPVVYLLHGLSDDHTCWRRYTSIERYANQYQCVVVMPEVQRSFYAGMRFGPAYFQYISRELPEQMEAMFGVRHRREKTLVAGLSMGGYGAVKCALTRPELFGCCASFSGALDIARRFEAEDRPEFQAIAARLEPENDLMHLAAEAAALPPDSRPAIYITCGLSDFLYEDNQAFLRRLRELDLAHAYEEWPGAHEWGFWDESVRRALARFLGQGGAQD